MENKHYDWSDLAFTSKKPLRELRAIFIAAPRELTAKWFTQLVKSYLPKGNIILGLAKESYVEGFEDQPQFRMLQADTVQSIIDKVNASASNNKIYTLTYFQRELVPIVEKIVPSHVLCINGSWKFSFHTLPIYYALFKLGISYELIPAFGDFDEAQAYTKVVSKEIIFPVPTSDLTAEQMLALADVAAKQSFDYGFQTGLILAKQVGTKYHYIANAFNRVVPFQGQALLTGASREVNFSPSNDLNFYDTIHAEMDLLVHAQEEKLDLRDATLFINLLPCPTCARTIASTAIAHYIYRNDHSEGYAAKLLQSCGKTIKRIV